MVLTDKTRSKHLCIRMQIVDSDTGEAKYEGFTFQAMTDDGHILGDATHAAEYLADQFRQSLTTKPPT